ncbi:MAG: peptide/nickel transport system permease protein, partial [Actinomycetota bacterium]|nr:peptide/nickel transport system permease protein [Actinomycetota bacterium]
MSSTVAADLTPPPSGTVGRKPRGGNPLVRYIVVRFLLIFPTIFILVSIVFVVMRVIGDPITA